MKTLIMIPGMMCDARLFEPQIALLSGDVNIIIPNLTEHKSIAGFAKDILANAPQQFALLGLSMGGIIAMEILRQAKGRVEKLALLDTNPLAEKNDIKTRRRAQMEAAKNGKFTHIMRHEIKPNYLAAGPLQMQILDLCMEMAKDLGVDTFINQSMALMDRRDQTATLKSIDKPTLVLCGEEDRLCPVERHELMYDIIPQAELAIISGAGHMPVLEQPEHTNAIIKTWIEK